MATPTAILGAIKDHCVGITPTGEEVNSTDLALANLGTVYPQDGWRSTNPTTAEPFLGTESKYSRVDHDLTESLPIGTIAAMATRASSTGKARFRLSTSAIPARVFVLPDATSGLSSNITGTHADVLENIETAAPDGNAILANSTGSARAQLTFAAPASNPVSGDGRQVMAVMMKADAGQAISALVIKIYSDLVEKVTLLSGGTVAATKRRVFLLPWDIDDLDDATGGTARIDIVWEGDGQIDCVNWLCLLTAADVETDLIEFQPSAMTGGALASENIASSMRLSAAYHYSSGGVYQTVNARYLQTEFFDYDNTLGYHAAGRIMAGPSIYLGSDVTTGATAHGFQLTGRFGNGDLHERSVIAPASLLTPKIMSQLESWGGMMTRQSLFCFHLLPGETEVNRTAHHLPFLATTGEVSGTELYANGGSRYGASLKAVEWWGP